MIDQFFGKIFKHSLLAFFGLLVVSALSFYFHLGFVVLPIIGIFTFALALKKIEFGVCVAFIELLSSAHGHLIFHDFNGFALSLRMVVFVSVMLAWIIRFILKKSLLDFKDVRIYLFALLSIAVVIGFLNGFLHHDTITAFKDGNAYLYILYALPVFSIHWDSKLKRAILQILGAGAVFASVVSFLILYLYSHFSEPVLANFYIFLRDVRLAEITPVGFGIYRAFLQTQIFVILFAIVLVPFLFLKQDFKSQKVLVLSLGVSIAVILQSMSRSFWFGLVFAISSVVVLLLINKTKALQWFQSVRFILGALVLSIAVLAGVIFFPFPKYLASTNFSGLMQSRLGSDDVGITSRWNLLKPMVEKIKDNPIFGNGFGETVTFKTDDPRARAINPDGTWTTYSMEWGWLEIWLKMGILGPVAFLLIFIQIFRQSFRLLMTEKKWIGFWVFVSAVFLLMTNIFSPYLNHPIGIGILLMLLIFVPVQPLTVPVFEKVQIKKQRTNPSLAVTSVQSKR